MIEILTASLQTQRIIGAILIAIFFLVFLIIAILLGKSMREQFQYENDELPTLETKKEPTTEKQTTAFNIMTEDEINDIFLDEENTEVSEDDIIANNLMQDIAKARTKETKTSIFTKKQQ